MSGQIDSIMHLQKIQELGKEDIHATQKPTGGIFKRSIMYEYCPAKGYVSSMSAFIVCITMGSSLFRMEKPLYRNFLTYVQVKSRYEQGTFYFPALAKNALLVMDIYGRNLYGVCMSLNAACKNPSFQGNRIETQNCFYSKTIQLFFEFRATRIKNSLRLSVVELPLRPVNINMNYSFTFLSFFTHTSIKRLV